MTFFLFTLPHCAECKVLKDWIPAHASIDYRIINASTPEGFEMAKRFNVNHTPTCILFDDEYQEVERAFDLKTIQKLIDE